MLVPILLGLRVSTSPSPTIPSYTKSSPLQALMCMRFHMKFPRAALFSKPPTRRDMVAGLAPICCSHSPSNQPYIRFPDSGSYNSWVALQAKIQAATASPGFSATGDLAFIPDWQTVLTNEPLQISQQSMTGFKEAHDLGYQLRARYPDFYKDGNDFMVWANQYASPINESRVVQTARAFLQGYLYVYAETYGTVVAVNSTGSAAALGDSLSPADLCPAYTNNAVNNVTDCKP